MDAATLARIKDLTRELYEETPPENLNTLNSIEQSVRGHLLRAIAWGMSLFRSLSKSLSQWCYPLRRYR